MAARTYNLHRRMPGGRLRGGRLDMVQLDRNARAFNAGASAGYRREPYEDNPHLRGTPEHLNWSKGHNEGRAQRQMHERKLK